MGEFNMNVFKIVTGFSGKFWRLSLTIYFDLPRSVALERFTLRYFSRESRVRYGTYRLPNGTNMYNILYVIFIIFDGILWNISL